jgi:hypothetical protein
VIERKNTALDRSFALAEGTLAIRSIILPVVPRPAPLRDVKIELGFPQ